MPEVMRLTVELPEQIPRWRLGAREPFPRLEDQQRPEQDRLF